MWPRHSLHSLCTLQCDHCMRVEGAMYHTLLDPLDDEISIYKTYNPRGWLLCNSCRDKVAPLLRKQVFDYVRSIQNRQHSTLPYQLHCLPFPLKKNTPFRIDKGDDCGFFLLASCAYYNREVGWHILATRVGGDRETYRVIPVKEWERLNPHLVCDATRFFTSGSMFREQESRWLDV